MALKHNYSGYTSYDYVRSHRDFTEYDLIEGESLFEPYLVPLNASQEARMLDLAGRILMISLHEHPHLFPARADQIRAYDSEGRVHTAYEALADSWWDCVFDNFLDGAACITSKNGWKWDDVIYDMGMRFCDLAHQDFIIKCEVVDDIHRAHREGRIALVAAQEGAAMIENELDRIEILYGIGLRVLGITYSESNALGTGLKETRDGGLTSFGRKAVTRMNDVGLAIDCAHASDQTTQGEFKRSSQHLREMLRWQRAGTEERIEPYVRGCVHQAVRRWDGASIGRGSGKRSLEVCRARRPPWQRVCPLLSGHAGFANVVACHHSIFVPSHGAISRSLSEKRSPFFEPVLVACARSPGSWAAHPRRSRENCGATQLQEEGTSSIGPRPLNGTPTGERNVQSLRSSLRTAN